MKKLRVFGHTEVTVSVAIEVGDDEELDEDEIYARAEEVFRAKTNSEGKRHQKQITTRLCSLADIRRETLSSQGIMIGR